MEGAREETANYGIGFHLILSPRSANRDGRKRNQHSQDTWEEMRVSKGEDVGTGEGEEGQTKWHWQVHCRPEGRMFVANEQALFLGMVV